MRLHHSSTAEDGAPLVLRASNITHRYGGATALSNVDFDISEGEIHALVGENGAGKSTLIKVLTGAVTPSEGSLAIGAQAIVVGSPSEAQALGIGVVHQDYNLFPDLSVATNICGVAKRRGGWSPLVNRGALNRTASVFMRELGLDLDPSRPVVGLPAAERKLVEIARALVQKPRFLLLDEPTAALEPAETDRLLAVISSLRDKGTGIILVTHRLGEICRVADRATALRDGLNVGSLARGELTTGALTRLMVGTDVEEHAGPAHTAGNPKVELSNLRLRPDARPVDLTVGEREIVAVIGLVGSGCDKVLGALVGAHPVKHAAIRLDGKPIRIRRPLDAVRHGIGYAPEDRKRLGLVMDQSIRMNMGLASLQQWSTGPFSSNRALDRAAQQSRELFDLRCRDMRQSVASLSGGNQQKVLLARWQLADAAVLVLHEPSQGVDVHARRAIHDYLLGYAAAGGSVLFSSSDIDEVRAIAHRIYVMHAGEVTQIFDNSGPDRPSRAAITESVAADPRLRTPIEVAL